MLSPYQITLLTNCDAYVPNINNIKISLKYCNNGQLFTKSCHATFVAISGPTYIYIDDTAHI